jgi:hypothetical protein
MNNQCCCMEYSGLSAALEKIRLYHYVRQCTDLFYPIECKLCTFNLTSF